ncbi:hypothetical protein CBM2609_B140055 [Cupriavidus taiwanensis]|nr:hypothetical protein CBM2604_B150056 [Cupriavidus taiwanensis]SOZ31997.1 hypothetical protein CBM2609_B140055 [Cupriavidus taiwanensis]SOZ47677.1 hypothetical protein CBM2610_B120055 [Cupriavidus taiwanensis]
MDGGRFFAFLNCAPQPTRTVWLHRSCLAALKEVLFVATQLTEVRKKMRYDAWSLQAQGAHFGIT